MEYEKVDGKVGDKDIDFGSVKDYDHGGEQESDKEYDREMKKQDHQEYDWETNKDVLPPDDTNSFMVSSIEICIMKDNSPEGGGELG